MRRTRPDESKCGSKELAIMGKRNEGVDVRLAGGTVEQGPLAAWLSGRRGDLGNAGDAKKKKNRKNRRWRKRALCRLCNLCEGLEKGEGMCER